MEVKKWQVWVVKLNRFLDTPLGMLAGFAIIMAIVVLFFVVRGSATQQKALQIAQDTNVTLQNTEKLLEGQIEEAKQRDAAVNRILEQTDKQTELIVCLLAIHGEAVAITEADEERCRELVFEAKVEAEAAGNATP